MCMEPAVAAAGLREWKKVGVQELEQGKVLSVQSACLGREVNGASAKRKTTGKYETDSSHISPFYLCETRTFLRSQSFGSHLYAWLLNCPVLIF